MYIFNTRTVLLVLIIRPRPRLDGVGLAPLYIQIDLYDMTNVHNSKREGSFQ